jgi:hypothetical protein
MEQLDYNLLFRWFVGLEIDEPVWNQGLHWLAFRLSVGLAGTDRSSQSF